MRTSAHRRRNARPGVNVVEFAVVVPVFFLLVFVLNSRLGQAVNDAVSQGVVAAWDTDGQIYFATIQPGTTEFTKPQAVPGPGKARKHPALAIGAKGELLLAWTEGTGWQKGGSLAWQLFDRSGRPLAEKGRLDGAIPVWSLASVVVRPDGDFTILY